MQDENDVSRRDFFKTVGVGSIATAVVAGVRDAEAQGPAPVGPGDIPITLTINGQRHQLSVEPRVTLLDAMRTRLEITGQKRVCDRGACGACTVIIEGRTYYSCSSARDRSTGAGHPDRRWPSRTARRSIPCNRPL
jgi:xanthine dehydrogenase YagT iron-sulfur-binding subunit